MAGETIRTKSVRNSILDMARESVHYANDHTSLVNQFTMLQEMIVHLNIWDGDKQFQRDWEIIGLAYDSKLRDLRKKENREQ